jgi:hypothetical protein
MFDFWKDELTEEQTQTLVDKCANEIRRRQLEAPAIVFFEMHKPISNVFAHAGLTLAPFLVPLFGFDFVNDYSNLLQKRDNVERLIQMLEVARSNDEVGSREKKEEICLTKK